MKQTNIRFPHFRFLAIFALESEIFISIRTGSQVAFPQTRLPLITAIILMILAVQIFYQLFFTSKIVTL